VDVEVVAADSRDPNSELVAVLPNTRVSTPDSGLRLINSDKGSEVPHSFHTPMDGMTIKSLHLSKFLGLQKTVGLPFTIENGKIIKIGYYGNNLTRERTTVNQC